ncbi:hypothetical protein CDAR_184971 [Caerostris darwini]|uniref:Uncharacterized protein n=1 Tax=Caerostris darwini TaxID=1538125 RepID=A0AAV4SVR1_9ARAC|nr:hypothetical protein CDAR_184971 [Caerostris darwini]
MGGNIAELPLLGMLRAEGRYPITAGVCCEFASLARNVGRCITYAQFFSCFVTFDLSSAGKEVGKKIISFPSSIRLGGEKRTSDPIIRERQDGLTQRNRSRMMLTPSRVGQGIAASAVDYRFEGCKGLGPTRAI